MNLKTININYLERSKGDIEREIEWEIKRKRDFERLFAQMHVDYVCCKQKVWHEELLILKEENI